MRLVIGMTGATGAILGVRLLELTRRMPDVETHLVLSRWARATIELETDRSVRDVMRLADVVHSPGDQASVLSSGSFPTSGMIVVPCSAKTLAAIRSGICGDLITRAADVTIKERRRLVLAVREAPLSPIHLENMLELSKMGVTIMPPMPAFYAKPSTLDEMCDHLAGRLLDQVGLSTDVAPRWLGTKAYRTEPDPLSAE